MEGIVGVLPVVRAVLIVSEEYSFQKVPYEAYASNTSADGIV